MQEGKTSLKMKSKFMFGESTFLSNATSKTRSHANNESRNTTPKLTKYYTVTNIIKK